MEPKGICLCKQAMNVEDSSRAIVILCFSKRSQGLNELETQILKRQNKGKAFVQKVVQPLADEIPPAAHLILLLLNSFLIPLLLLNALLYSYVIPIDLNYALLFKYILLF